MIAKFYNIVKIGGCTHATDHTDSRMQPPILAIVHIAKFGDRMLTVFTFWYMNI